MPSFRSLVVAALLVCETLAGDDDWESPVYKNLYSEPLPLPKIKEKKFSYTNSTTGNTIDYYEIEVKPFEQQVYPGLKKAKLVGYDGISPGPTFKMERGREAVVRFINHSPNDFSVHLHGSYSRTPFDGWAEDVTKQNQYKDYYYPNKQSARTLWYHDHAIHHTAENAYFGQAGFYILHDSKEDQLDLPAGDYDVPLALASKQYNSDGTLFSPASETTSLYGDVIHVNGQPWPYFKVEPRKYRFRFLDSSISRAFKLYFQDPSGKTIPFHMIGSDAGLLTKPVPTTNLEISMAERWEVVIDFSAYAGKNVTLRNNRDVQADEDYNSTDKVMRFVVGTTAKSQQGNGPLPGSLRVVPLPPPKSGVDRTFRFERSGGQWTVNGVTFADVKNRILANPKRGTVEVWDLVNSSGGWSHPVHIHLIDMQIIARSNGKRGVLPYEKEALKDVVLLGTGETVRVLARYAPYDGVYMFHCHNLIHEDHDMMAAFNVTSLGDWGYPETTHFIDPMEQKYRAVDENDNDSQEANIKEKLAKFDLMNAYLEPEKLEAALVSYWDNGGPTAKPQSTFSTVTVRSTSTTSSTAVAPLAPTPTPTTTKAPSVPAAATTTKPRTTSTKKDNSGKNTTKR